MLAPTSRRNRPSTSRHRILRSAHAGAPRHGVARVLSKRGVCSRSEAARLVAAGRVSVDGQVVRDPEHPASAAARICIDGRELAAAVPLWVALNKPRGLVTTASDEAGRDTVYRCLDTLALPWVAPVGRLDKGSEGLLLFCNDPAAAARLTDPAGGVPKTYHVQVSPVPEEAVLQKLRAGIIDAGERLHAERIAPLRAGARNAWLEIVLGEGRNRQIRRMLAAVGLETRRLVRVAIGPLVLGDLPKGGARVLSETEVAALLEAAAPRPAQP